MFLLWTNRDIFSCHIDLLFSIVYQMLPPSTTDSDNIFADA